MGERKMDNWRRFSHTRYGSMLVKFFRILNSEMTEINETSPKKDTILILNTKKGYWMYKLFEQEENASPVEICSDRYVKKIANSDRLKGKLIYLLDDTLTYGFSLLETYRRLVEVDCLKEEDICPLVFALNERVKLEEQIENSKGTESSFWRNLKYFIRMSGEEMSEFCVQETLLLHIKNVPYVTNLPYLKQEGALNMNYEVILESKQFKKLQQENSRWKFYWNSYKVEKIEFLKGFIIQYCDEQLLKLTQDFVFDYVMEGTCYEDEKGRVHLVFVPFVIAKSITKERLAEVWALLVGGDAGTELEQREDNLQKCYRECIFVLAILLANKFIEYLKDITGILLCYDFEILSDHYADSFVDKIKECCAELSTDSAFLYNKLKNLHSVSEMDDFVDVPSGAGCPDREVLSVVSEQILTKRISYLQRASYPEHNNTAADNAILQIEDIKNLLDRTFSFRNEEMRRFALSKVIITFLQSSVCSSQLFVSVNGNMVKKGVRYGENSDLALPFFNRYFYWAVILMAERVGEEKLLKNYSRFVRKLREKFQSLGFLDKSISESDFVRNAKYYKVVLENEFQLNNKLFYLYDFLHGETDSRENNYMNEIEKFVMNL